MNRLARVCVYAAISAVFAVGFVMPAVPAAAQTPTDTPTPPPSATATPPPAATVDTGAISGAVAAGIGSGIDSWVSTNGETMALRIVGWIVGAAVKAFAQWVAPVLGATAGDNLLVTLPASLTTRAPWVRDSWSMFRLVTSAALGGGFVLLLILSGLRGLAWGITWGEVTGAFPAVVAALIGINASLDLADGLRELMNALSLAFVDGASRLPGWEQLSSAQQLTGDGLTLICLTVLSVFLAIGRFITLELFNLCVVIAPLAILLLLVPGGARFGQWVAGKLVGSAVVQVPQAICIGQGAALVAAFGAGGSAMYLGLGIACYWLAYKVPSMLPGLSNHGEGLFGRGLGLAKLAALGMVMPAVGAVAGATTISQVGHFGGMAAGLPGATTTLLEGSFRALPLAPSAMRALPAPQD